MASGSRRGLARMGSAADPHFALASGSHTHLPRARPPAPWLQKAENLSERERAPISGLEAGRALRQGRPLFSAGVGALGSGRRRLRTSEWPEGAARSLGWSAPEAESPTTVVSLLTIP